MKRVIGWMGIAAWLLPLLATAAAEPLVTLRTATAGFAIDDHGSLSEISRAANGHSCLAADQPAPLLSVRLDGTLYAPDSATWDVSAQRLTLRYGGTDAVAVLTAQAKPTHVVFAVVDVRTTHHVELVLWGPYPTTIGDIVGETVGVVRDPEFAIGIQTLNAKTLGGYPKAEDDIQVSRGDTARATAFGSVLQAYCRNRDRDRIIPNWGLPKFLAPAFHDGGVIGSKIALFGCPAAQALDTIGAIEVAEGLPHPLLDGVWCKVAPGANCSYLIVDFGENSIDRAIAMTQRAGLKYLYNSSPFETWGHFKLKPSLFPHGWEGLRTCAEKARQAGLRVGFHTLSNFITPNDPYVTPKPDSRLARIGASALTAELDAAQKEVPLDAPDYFQKKTALNTVVIGDELIRYGSVSAEAPWRLLDCQRGAWSTRATAHARGAVVAKLMDHSYNVFLTDADLSQEVARNIARLCNETGARQLSFDGLEGNWSTGMGQYGRVLFTKAWYDALSPELRGQVINDASNPSHFNWHICTRMNWGEPWYAGFRESQTLYRFKNQVYFEHNLMPRMLGWFALSPETSLEDVEWLLARAAGFEAGFALATSLASTAQLEADPNSADATRQFGALPAILEAVKQWETARTAGAFPREVKAELRDHSREFHLEPAGAKRWSLREFHLQRLTHDTQKEAPTTLRFQSAQASQPLQWIIRNAGKQAVAGLTVTVNGKPAVDLVDRALPPGGALRYRGGAEAVICDSAWREIGRAAVDANTTQIGSGEQDLAVGCRPQSGGSLKLEFRTLGQRTEIAANSPASSSIP